MSTLPHLVNRLANNAEPASPAIPDRSASRPHALPNEQLNVDVAANPIPKAPARFNCDKTTTSNSDIPNFKPGQETHIGRVSTRHASVDTESSVVDSAVDLKSPARSGKSAPKFNTAGGSDSSTPQLSTAAISGYSTPRSTPSRAVVVEKSFEALAKANDNIEPEAGMHEATPTTQSAFKEHLAPSASEDSGHCREDLLSVSEASRRTDVEPRTWKSLHAVRRTNSDANLRPDTRPSETLREIPYESTQQERIPFIDTYNEMTGRRETVLDRRPSTARERRAWEEIIDQGTIKIFENPGLGSTEELPQEPIPGALHAHRHSYRAHRVAPPPPAKKSRNPFKRLLAWARGLDERWDAHWVSKRRSKEERLGQKAKAVMAKAAERQARRENKSGKQQRRRDEKAKEIDRKASVKRDLAAHKERQKSYCH